MRSGPLFLLLPLKITGTGLRKPEDTGLQERANLNHSWDSKVA